MMQEPTTEAPAPASRRGEREGGELEGREMLESDGELSFPPPANAGQEVQQQWLSIGKRAAEAKCTELEKQLAATREELTKRDTRFVCVVRVCAWCACVCVSRLSARDDRERETERVLATLVTKRSHYCCTSRTNEYISVD